MNETKPKAPLDEPQADTTDQENAGAAKAGLEPALSAASEKPATPGETATKPGKSGQNETKVAANPEPKKDDAAKAKAEKKPAPGPTGPKKPRAVVAGTIAVLALLLAGAAGGGSYWLWRQVTELQARTGQLAGAVASAQDVGQSANQNVESLGQNVQSLNQDIDGVRQQLDQRVNAINSQQEALNAELQSLYSRIGSNSRDWVIAEAEYLMQVANHRLELAHDVKTATIALQAADRRLKQIGDPALVPVRQDLATEINALRAVDVPDTTGMALTLSSLAGSVEKLPLEARFRTERPQQAKVEAPKETSNWRSVLAAIWANLKSLVTVRYEEKPVAPLLPPSQVQNLYENLALKLEVARLALLQGNEQTFRSTLDTVRQWINAYFDVNSQAAKSMLETVQQLEATTIQPPLPDISGSLRALRKVATKLEAQPPAGGKGKGAAS